MINKFSSLNFNYDSSIDTYIVWDKILSEDDLTLKVNENLKIEVDFNEENYTLNKCKALHLEKIDKEKKIYYLLSLDKKKRNMYLIK